MTISNREKAKSLQKYHAETTDIRAYEISVILKESECLKLKFPNRTALSEYVAKKLSKNGSRVSSSTIRRNDKYNDLLIDYLLSICPETIVNKVDLSIESQLLQRDFRKKLEEKDKKIAQLERRALDAEILMSKRLELEHNERIKSQTPLVDPIKNSNEEADEDLFEELYKALSRLEVIELQLEDDIIYDWEEDEALMVKRKFPKFFKWLKTKMPYQS